MNDNPNDKPPGVMQLPFLPVDAMPEPVPDAQPEGAPVMPVPAAPERVTISPPPVPAAAAPEPVPAMHPKQAAAMEALKVNRAAREAAAARGGPREDILRVMSAGAPRPVVAGVTLAVLSPGLYQLMRLWAALPELRPDGADLVFLFRNPLDALDALQHYDAELRQWGCPVARKAWEVSTLRLSLQATPEELAAAVEWIEAERAAFFASPAAGTAATKPETGRTASHGPKLPQPEPGAAVPDGGCAPFMTFNSTGRPETWSGPSGASPSPIT